MSLIEDLAKIGFAVGGYLTMVAYIESLRGSTNKEEKEFVAAWDKLLKERQAQADLKQMEVEASKLSYQQRAFKQKWDKYLK